MHYFTYFFERGYTIKILLFTSALIKLLPSAFTPQYPIARLGELTNNWPTVPEPSTGSRLSFKMYAPEFITGSPIGTCKTTSYLRKHLL